MRRRFAALALALALALAPAAEAGPWAVGRGHVYAKLSYEFLRARELAQPDGTLFDIPRFDKQSAGLYVAYGVSDRVTLLGNLPAWRSSELQDFGRESGFGDVQLGAQLQLGRSGAWVFAVRGYGQAPTGDEDRADGLLPTGSGAWEAEGSLGAGRSIAGGRGYGFAEAGYLFRGSGLRDGLTYAGQLGWNVSGRVVLIANVRGVEPRSHAARAVPIGSPVGLGDRVTYVNYGPSAIVKLGKSWGVQGDVEWVARARNLARGTTFRGGIFFSR